MVTATLFIIARTWKQPRCPSTEGQTCGTYIQWNITSHIKKCICVHSNEVNEPRAYYTEWSKSEKQVYNINAYMKFRKTKMTLLLQDSKRDTSVKNRLLDSVGEGEGGIIWENSIETCILPYVK